MLLSTKSILDKIGLFKWLLNMADDKKTAKMGPCSNRPYTYPECVEFLKRIAREYTEFGYFEIDRAIAKTIEEALQKDVLQITPLHYGAKFKLLPEN